jgi:glycosyltransferase involved in cell wall biosynthesis
MLLKLPAKIQYKLVVHKKHDIEIAFNRGAAAHILSGSTNDKAKKLVWVHSDYMRNDNPLAGFKSLKDAQHGYAKYDQIVCVSEQAQIAFAEKFGEGYPICTRYNIMNFERIRSLSYEKNIDKKRFTIVAVGRLCEAKNYTLLMDAIDLLNKRNIDIDCWIVGDGILKDELTKYKEDRKLENVIFIGSKVNPYPYMRCADLYVSSSIYEGMSTTTIEALILGKACVVTDCTGMRNILGENNEYGVVVPIEVNSLADAILNMMNESLRCDYERRAIQRSQYFDPELAFLEIENLFRD